MSTTAQILKLDDAEEFRDLGGLVRILSSRLETSNLFFAIGEFETGEGLARHYHAAPGEEIYYVLRGEATVFFGGDTLRIPAGTCLVVPPEVHHGVTNEGSERLDIAFIIAPKERAEPILV